MVIYVFILIIILLWATCFILFNDLFIPQISLRKYKNVLFVFSHMDDESVLAGGTIAQLVSDGKNVTLMILTKGDKGNNERRSSAITSAIRKKELSSVLNIFGVKNLIHLNYPDETLREHKNKVSDDVRKTIEQIKPDLVVTFDEYGWYGHEDHIVCYEAVKKSRQIINTFTLLHAVRPEAINRAARFVAFFRRFAINKRSKPLFKYYIGKQIFKKTKAIYAYKSQTNALRPGVTVGPIPMWFFLSASPFEYFVNE